MSQLKQNIYYNDSGELVVFTYREYTEEEGQKRLDKLFPPEEKTASDLKISKPQRPPAWLRPKPAGKRKLPEEGIAPKPEKRSQKKQPIISPVSCLVLNPQRPSQTTPPP